MVSDEKLQTVVAIGASAGGTSALIDLIRSFPKNLRAPVIVAVHSQPGSILAEVLSMKCDLPIKAAEDGERLKDGWIYIVPGARHAFVGLGYLRLSKIVENSGFRPSIDALFMTLAGAYGDRAIGIILSGTLRDGMRGTQVIHDMGGLTLVQDPKEARYTSMPESVISADHPEVVLSAADLGVWLATRVGHGEQEGTDPALPPAAGKQRA